MSTEFLDKTGLAYFWSKIKAWAVAAFAAISHSHASQDVTAMTGYSKPGSSSAIAVGDTLNQAIGKLEYKVDAYDDSNYVHKTGDELIDGYKGFKSIYVAKRLDGVTRGTLPDVEQYSAWAFDDVDGRLLGNVEMCCRPATATEYGNSRTDLKLWVKPVSANPGSTGAALVVGWDDQGRRFATCPSTQSGRTFGNDILTRDWIPNDTRIVHTSGDEDISGYKTFTTRHPIKIKCDVTAGTAPSSNYYSGLRFVDNNNRVLSYLEYTYYTDGGCSIKFEIDSLTTSDYDVLSLYRDANDVAYAIAPSTRTDRTGGTDILTRNWIPKDDRIVHTSGDEVIAGNKTFTWNQYLKDTSAAYDSITGGGYSLVFRDKNDVEVGRIQNMYSSSDNCTLLRVYLRDRSRDYQVGLRDSGAIYFGPRGTGSSGTINLGQAGNYWKEVFAYSSAINTSDARLKRNIVNISDVVLDAWENIDWKQFKMVDAIEAKGKDKARWHTGLVAQDLDKIFSDLGLEIRDYGFFCYDEWQAEPRIEKDGEVLNEGREAGNQYALRYIEALSVEAAYMRRENARLKERVSSLEDRLAALELRFGSA